MDIGDGYDISDTHNRRLWAQIRRRVFIGTGMGVFSMILSLFTMIILLMVIASHRTPKNVPIIRTSLNMNCRQHYTEKLSNFSVHYFNNNLTLVQRSGSFNVIHLTKGELSTIINFTETCIMCLPGSHCPERARFILYSKLFIPRFTRCAIPTQCYLLAVKIDCEDLLTIVKLVGCTTKHA